MEWIYEWIASGYLTNILLAVLALSTVYIANKMGHTFSDRVIQTYLPRLEIITYENYWDDKKRRGEDPLTRMEVSRSEYDRGSFTEGDEIGIKNMGG